MIRAENPEYRNIARYNPNTINKGNANVIAPTNAIKCRCDHVVQDSYLRLNDSQTVTAQTSASTNNATALLYDLGSNNKN